MKDSKTLLLEYLSSVRDPEHAASLFAEDGIFEFLDLGVHALALPMSVFRPVVSGNPRQ